MFITQKPLQQQADAAGGGTGAGAGAGAAGGAGTGDNKSGQQQGQQQTGAQQQGAAGQQGAQASQGQAQQQASKEGQATDASKGAGAKAGAQAEIAIKLPDGTKADPKFVEAYVTTAKKHGLSQEQAQGVAEFMIETQKASNKAYEEALQRQVSKDTEALRADKEFGGVNFDKTVKARDSALAQFFGEETAKLVKELGLEANPGFAKGLARIRALVSEDTVGDKGAKPGAATTTREAELRKMFPHSYDQMVPQHR